MDLVRQAHACAVRTPVTAGLLLLSLSLCGCTGGGSGGSSTAGEFVLRGDSPAPAPQLPAPPPPAPGRPSLPDGGPAGVPEPASFVAMPDDASATAVVVTGADRRVLAPRWPRTSLVQVVAGRVYLSTPKALGCGSDNVVVPLGGGAPRPAFKDDPGWVAFSVSGDGRRVVALQRPGRTGTDCGVGRPFDLILRGDGPERSFPLASRGADVGLVLDSAGRTAAFTRTGSGDLTTVVVLDVTREGSVPTEVVPTGSGCALTSPAWVSADRLAVLSLCPDRRVSLDVVDVRTLRTLSRTLLAKPPAGPVSLDLDASGAHPLVVLPGADSTPTAFAVRAGRLERLARGVLRAQW